MTFLPIPLRGAGVVGTTTTTIPPGAIGTRVGNFTKLVFIAT